MVNIWNRLKNRKNREYRESIWDLLFVEIFLLILIGGTYITTGKTNWTDNIVLMVAFVIGRPIVNWTLDKIDGNTKHKMNTNKDK